LYNRPSYRVTVLRRQQVLLAAQCRVEEADHVAKLIEEGVRQDEKEHARARQRDYEESMTKLKAKQAGELEFFDEQCVIEVAQLKQQREGLRKVISNKTKKVEKRQEMIKDVDRLWNATQAERLGQITAGSARGKKMPSSHIPIAAVDKLEGAFLALPPLNFDGDMSARGSRRRKRADE
jgi:hypothetical protein